MIEHPDGTRTPRHRRQRAHLLPVQQRSAQLPARAVQKPRFPRLRDGLVRRAGRRVRAGTERARHRQYPGSDPEFVANELFSKRGVDVAVLHPMSRGIMPDRHLGSALHAAHNEMMVSRWLESQRIRRPVPRHHPGQPRRHRRRAARDRQVARRTRASSRSASRCSPASCTANRSSGRCGKRPPTPAFRWPCTSRSATGIGIRADAVGTHPAPTSSTSASWR